MKKTGVLIKERMTVGAHIIDIRRSRVDTARQSIILVHGIGMSSRYFIPFAKHLAVTYNVITFDLPGYGKTPKPDHPLSIAELADVVNQIVCALQLERPVIFGHSMGGQIVARAVQKDSALYQKMILLGPTVNAKERSLLMQTMRLLQDTPHESFKAGLIIFTDYTRMGLRRYLQTSRYMLHDHIEEALPDCTIPTLIVRGEKDKIVPDEWAQLLTKITPDAQSIEVLGGPHALHYRMATALAAVCHQFISKN